MLLKNIRETVGRVARHLPVLKDRPDLVRAIADARCVNCKSFDLAEGQRQLSNAASFPLAELTPDQMGNIEAKGSIEGEQLRPFDDIAATTTAKLGGRIHSWSQYGACAMNIEIVNQFDHCEKWS